MKKNFWKISIVFFSVFFAISINSYSDNTRVPPQWTISGTIIDGTDPIPNVTVSITRNGNPYDSTTTDSSGNYLFPSLIEDYTYVVKPTKTHYTFNPIDKSIYLTNDVNNADFTGTLDQWTISGTITDTNSNPVSNVTVNLTGDSIANTITDGSGNYSFNNLDAGATYVITPNSIKYSFTPSFITHPNLSSDITGDTFTATLLYYDISGTITESGNPLSNVTVNLTGDSTATTITDISGNYSFNNLDAGAAYIVTPTKGNWTFSPENASYANLDESKTQDFVGTKMFATDLTDVKVYPNPCKNGTITFNNLTENAKIQIYTITGKLVFEGEADSIDYQWYLKNEDDKDIASGVYIYYISNDKGDKKTGKFVVIQ